MNRRRLALRWVFILLSGLTAFSTQAVYTESTIYEMPSDKAFISKRIYNDSQKQNLYSIGAVKLISRDREVKTEVLLLKANFCLLR